MSESDWTIKLNGVTHWAADDSDFSVACDMATEEVEITCVQCLTMLVKSQHKQIIDLMYLLESQK